MPLSEWGLLFLGMEITVKDFNDIKQLYFNTVYLGYCYREVDGFYVFIFVGQGCWSDYALRMVADKLTELNKEWSDQIDRFIEGL